MFIIYVVSFSANYHLYGRKMCAIAGFCKFHATVRSNGGKVTILHIACNVPERTLIITPLHNIFARSSCGNEIFTFLPALDKNTPVRCT